MTFPLHMTLQSRRSVTEALMLMNSMRFPHADEMPSLHATFQPMIAAPITSDAQVGAVHAQTGQCVFVHEDKEGNLAGSMLLIQLSQAGLAHLQSGARLGRVIDPNWVCKATEIPAALLVWGLLGRNAWFSGRVLAFAMALACRVYADMPILTYAATADGARIMDRVGFRPSEVPGLFQLDLSIRQRRHHA